MKQAQTSHSPVPLQEPARRKNPAHASAAPAVAAQARFVEGINSSPYIAAQRRKFQSLFGGAAQLEADPAQRVQEEEPLQGKFDLVQKVEEEEPLQGKFEAVQRVEEEEPLQGKAEPLQRLEEEEPLQGKFEPVQRVEEEEPLQGKFEPVQRVEEEEPLQGKFEAVQRVEEEEPLQGKAEPLQRLEEEEPLQGKFAGQAAQLEAQPAPAPSQTGLPDNLKSGIESLSGISMDHVRVHYNSSQPAQLNALAYAQGTDIHVAPGQEKHLPHEAWHVVQQAQGRVQPTMQMKECVPVNDDKSLEQEADVMGARALQFSGRYSPISEDREPAKPAQAGRKFGAAHAAAAQMRRNKLRGHKQRLKLREPREPSEPLPGRRHRRLQAQETGLTENFNQLGVRLRRQQHQAHLNRLAKAERNFQAQEKIHIVRRWRRGKGVADRLNALITGRAEMILEIQRIIELANDADFVDAKSKGGISNWARRNPEQYGTWKQDFNETHGALENAQPAQLIANVRKFLSPEPEDDASLSAAETQYKSFGVSFKLLTELAERYEELLNFINGKWELTKGRRNLPPPARGRVAGLTKEYPLGGKNIVPHIHHYGNSYHLKINDPARNNQVMRYNLVKDGKRDGQADLALAAATAVRGSQPNVLPIVQAILNLY